MPPQTNCPNCSAPITGPVCEYCGTRHYYPGTSISGMASHIGYFIQIEPPTDQMPTTASCVIGMTSRRW